MSAQPPPAHSQPWTRSPARDIALLALIAALIMVGRSWFRIPIHVPGHTGVFWMALLVIGKGASRRPWAGTLIGLVTGILAILLVPGKEGVLTALKYLAPGVMLDLVTPLLGGRLTDGLTAALAGALAHVAKNVTALVLGWALGIPMGFLAVGIGGSVTLHVVFGAVGGWLGSLLLRRLVRIGVVAPEDSP